MMELSLILFLLASLHGILPVHAVVNTDFGQYPDTCPSKCDTVGPEPAKWTHYHRLSDIARCNEPILFDLNIHTPVSDSNNQIIRACSLHGSKGFGSREDPKNSLTVANACGAKEKEVQIQPRNGPGTSPSSMRRSDVLSAADHLAAYLEFGANCGTTILFSKFGSIVVGLYSGADIHKPSAAEQVKRFRDLANPDSLVFELCDSGASKTFGLFAGSITDFPHIQNAVKTWSNSQCLVETGAARSSDEDITITVLDSTVSTNLPSTSLRASALCRDIQVNAGDICSSLASRCGISYNAFIAFNPKPNLCATLMPKQYVCCTAGDLPDHTPQPSPDGSCYTYTIRAGDNCWAIGENFGIDAARIEAVNKNTWGFAGCNYLGVGQVICLSTGTPPLPAAVPGVQCGPQKPGTVKPPANVPLQSLNQCRLNACCSAWGYCGITDEFCTLPAAGTGLGTNGCISNCGTAIVNNASPPPVFRKVGYYESWAPGRKCLKMEADELDVSGTNYTILHFAFAAVTAGDWKVDVSAVSEQFNKFKSLQGAAKKVISFGGFTFSNDPSTFQRFRDATKPENRDTFATNCVKFVTDNGLDGLDFDWEYPGAPDVTDMPPGTENEGKNYYEFLKLVRAKLVAGKTVSVALPASYWYLKEYPLGDMAGVVDYFVYMTYDFHGQWDMGSPDAMSGCPAGNCLRSHVNKTETRTALSMITKAGVPASKVLLGITSYARSFRMSNPTCRGPMCTFTGTKENSPAYPGRCTQSAGYISNAEINEVINKPGSYQLVTHEYDSASDSDILIYGSMQAADWAAYMSEETKKRRAEWAKGLNFGGTTDWAVDLMDFAGDEEV